MEICKEHKIDITLRFNKTDNVNTKYCKMCRGIPAETEYHDKNSNMFTEDKVNLIADNSVEDDKNFETKLNNSKSIEIKTEYELKKYIKSCPIHENAKLTL